MKDLQYLAVLYRLSIKCCTEKANLKLFLGFVCSPVFCFIYYFFINYFIHFVTYLLVLLNVNIQL